MKNDEYDLEQPRWISDLQFLHSERSISESQQAENFRIVVCTRFHQVRMYDTSMSTRPIRNFDVGEMPLLTLRLSSIPNQVIVSDSHSNITTVDIDTKTVCGKYKGATGAVVSLAVIESSYDEKSNTQTPPVLACVGLDRFLRLFNINTRIEIARVFCKTKMTQVVVLDVPKSEQKQLVRKRDANSDNDEDGEGGGKSDDSFGLVTEDDDDDSDNGSDNSADDPVWAAMSGVRGHLRKRRRT